MPSTASAKLKLLLGSTLALLLGLLGALPALHSAPAPKQGKAGWEERSSAPVCFALPQDENRKSPAEHPLVFDCDLAHANSLSRFSVGLGEVVPAPELEQRSTPRSECVRGPPAGRWS